MRRIQNRFRWLQIALFCSGVSGSGLADDLVIQSFEGNGRLSFNTLASATNYCVEWASSPAGPWTNTWASLLNIPVPVSGSVTCSVPMFYRVVATALTNEIPISTNATLANLFVYKGILTPAFHPSILSYTLKLNRNDDNPGSDAEMREFIKPIVSNTTAAVIISVDTIPFSRSVTSGSFLPPVTLPQGVNTFLIQVMTDNNLTSQTYTIEAEVDFIPPSIGPLELTLKEASTYNFADPASADVTCAFIVPGNDGYNGNCSQLIMKYATSPIFADQWDMAQSLCTWSNLTGGTSFVGHLTIPDADRGKTLYFALRGEDNLGNISAVSTSTLYVPSQPIRYVNYYLSDTDNEWKFDYSETLYLMSVLYEGEETGIYRIAAYAARNDASFNYFEWYCCLLDEDPSNQEFIRVSTTNCFEVIENPAKIIHRYVDSNGTTILIREATLTSTDKAALKSEMRAFLNNHVSANWNEYKTIDPQW